ncbi:sigma 54-interacting transcriptional regulator, partial [candidate division WOR-3 bacterium]|nr:sigma 54-interacting transcriptional regulator [candidate division WOR-3 bacterium]
DIYSMGIIAYESLTGKEVFNEDTTSKILEAVLYKNLQPIKQKNKDIPDFFNDVISRMSDKDRVNRFTSFESIIGVVQRRGKYKKEEKFVEKILYSDFIGRKTYIDYVYNLINQVSKGDGQISLIEGIAGTGKTRMLKEIEHRLFIDGKDVQYLRITEKSKLNFNWLIELLERKGADLKNLNEILEKGINTLSENEKYKFFERLAKELVKIFHDKIHIFLLDDTDFSDKVMCDFILYFSTFLENSPLLFIIATENIPDSLNSTIEDRIYKNVSKWKLSGLDKNETVLFVKNMLGITGNVEKISEYLYEKTDGNPYFIEELIREVVEKRLLKRVGNDLVYNLLDVKKISIPESVGLFVIERIKNVSEEEKEILKIVSVFGDAMPLSWLIKLSPYSESETIRLFEGPSLKQFFSIAEDDRFDFTHKLVRNIIYSSLNKKERTDAHKKILRFLEEQKETPFTLHLKTHHSYTSKDPKAEFYLQKLLKRSIKYVDSETAIDAFEKLKELNRIDVLLKTDKDILLKIGAMYRDAGGLDKAIALYNELLGKIREKSEKVKILHYLAVAKIGAGQYDGVENIFKKLLKEKLQIDQRFEILINLGWFYYSNKEYRRAERMYKKALSLSRKGLKKKVLIGKLYYNLYVLKQKTRELKEAEFYGNKVCVVGKKYDNRFYVMLGLHTLALLEQTKRRYDKAITYYKKALKCLEKTEDPLRRLHVLSNLARLLFYTGDIENSKKNYFNAVSEAKKFGNFLWISYLYNLYGRILSRNGEWQRALNFFEKSNKIAESINETTIKFSNIAEILFIYAFKGKTEEFESLLKKALSLKKQTKGDNKFLPIVLSQGIQKYVKSDFKVALSYLDKIEDTIGKLNVPEHQIPAMIFKSLCLFKMDERESAQRTIFKAKEMMDNTKMFLYSKEIEFIKLLIESKDSVTTEVKDKFKVLLDKTRKNQKFFYVRVLAALSNLNYKEFLEKQRKNSLSESISLLKEARNIFIEIDARPLISDVNDKLLLSYDTMLSAKIPKSEEKKYPDIISKFGELIKNISDPEQLKTAFISTAKSITGAERGLFLTLDNDSGEFIVSGKDIDDATIYDAKEFSKSVIKRVKKTRKPVIAYDAVSEKTFESYESVRINKIRSILCIPIVTDGKVLGALYLDSRRNPRLFSKEEQEFFSSLSMFLGDSLVKALEYKRMRDETTILKQNLRTSFGPENLIGRSENIQEVYDKIEKFADSSVPVLILGESGTGKELVARSIHFLSNRKEKNFLVVDCSTISSSLIESELFGYKRGAFTGAREDKLGHFEAAGEGTIFIDEIANATDSLQIRLLRFIDTQEVKRIGATKYKKVDTRIIIASNKDLYELVKEGKFREDLFHRLNKFIINLPPLRERKEDIKLLIDYYIDFCNKKHNKNIKGITNEVFELLYTYEWPGNVRDLRNEIERCVFFCNKKFISKEYISEEISKSKTSFLPLTEIKKILMQEYIMKVLSYTKGNVSKAARILQTTEKTIYRNLKSNEDYL